MTAVSMSSGLVACSSDVDRNKNSINGAVSIIGKWEIKKVATITNGDKDTIEVYVYEHECSTKKDNLEFMGANAGRTIQYNLDCEVEYDESFRYSIQENKIVFTDHDDEDVENVEIHELTKTKLVYAFREEYSGAVYESTMEFKRKE